MNEPLIIGRCLASHTSSVSRGTNTGLRFSLDAENIQKDHIARPQYSVYWTKRQVSVFKELMALAFLPHEHIPGAFEKLSYMLSDGL